MNTEDEVSEFLNEFLYDHGVVDSDGFHHHSGREFLVEVVVFAIKED